ncbi:fungal-specific transcription factor domain-containing protein [Schizophyllum commune]
MRGSSHHDHAQDASPPSSAYPGPSINAYSARLDERALEAGPSTHVAGTSSGKRRKLDRACDACRRRKTRCDGPTQPDGVCSTCRQSNKSCTYMETSKPRGPPKAYITGMEDKLERLEGLIRRLRPDIDLDAEFGPPVPRDSWRTEPPSRDSSRPRTRSGPSPLAFDPRDDARQTPSTSTSSPLPPRLGSSSDGESGSEWHTGEAAELTIEDVTGGVKLSLPSTDAEPKLEDRNVRFVGKASGAPWIIATRKFKDLHIAESNALPNSIASKLRTEADKSQLRRKEFWVSPDWELKNEGHKDIEQTLAAVQEQLPPPDLTLSLIDLYFTYPNMHIPLLHRPTFERQWRAGLHKRHVWFAAVCFAIFAVASRWSNDLRVVPESCAGGPDGPKWHAAGSQWFHISMQIIVRRHRSILYPASLHEIQLLTIQRMYMRGTHFFASAWLNTAVGTVKAQDIGAHRQSIYKDLKPADRELWKRAWWCLVLFDRMDSASLGRPCATREEDFDVDLLAEVDDEYWDTGNPETDFKQPTDKPSKITAFNLMIKLSGIVARTLRTVYSLDKADMPLGPFSQAVDPIVSQLNASLTEWVVSVPDHLKPNRIDDPIFANQAAFLFTNYYTTQMLIYRPFIPRTPTTVEQYKRERACPYPALAICLNAAKACVGIIQQQLPNGYANVPNLSATAYQAAGTLLFGWWELKARQHLVEEGAEDVRVDVNVMDQLLAHYKIAMQALEWAVPRWPHVELMIEHLKTAMPSAEDLLRRQEILPRSIRRAPSPKRNTDDRASVSSKEPQVTPLSATNRDWANWRHATVGHRAADPPTSRPLPIPPRQSSDVPPTTYRSRNDSLQPIIDRPRSHSDDMRAMFPSPTPYPPSPAGNSHLSPWSDVPSYAGPRSASPVDMDETERPVAISSIRRTGPHAQLRYGSTSAKYNESYARGAPASNTREPLPGPYAAPDRRATLGGPGLYLPPMASLQAPAARRSSVMPYGSRLSPYEQFKDAASSFDGRMLYEPIPAFEDRNTIYNKPRLQVQTRLDSQPSMEPGPRSFEGRYARASPVPPFDDGYGVSPNTAYGSPGGSWPVQNIATRGQAYTNYQPPSAYDAPRDYRRT